MDKANEKFFFGNKNKDGDGARATLAIVHWEMICRAKYEGVWAFERSRALIQLLNQDGKF